uniref:Uncharacterized protein n=1 Tax=Anguilla anguilla TaxID=7936 RepID=A0A0E9Q882_ANGAN
MAKTKARAVQLGSLISLLLSSANKTHRPQRNLL